MTLATSSPSKGHMSGYRCAALAAGFAISTAMLEPVQADIQVENTPIIVTSLYGLDGWEKITSERSFMAATPISDFPVSRAADPVISDIDSYSKLLAGWDGENAAQPVAKAISDACAFVRVLGLHATAVFPTLDVDGSVILEIDGDAGALKFNGDDMVVYALASGERDRVPFDGFSVPTAVLAAFS